MEKLPNIHPGEILLEEFLIPLNISRYRLAKAMAVSPIRINEICAGKRSITTDTALRLRVHWGLHLVSGWVYKPITIPKKPNTQQASG